MGECHCRLEESVHACDGIGCKSWYSRKTIISHGCKDYNYSGLFVLNVRYIYDMFWWEVEIESECQGGICSNVLLLRWHTWSSWRCTESIQFQTGHSIPQGHSTHTSHHFLSPLQTMMIVSYHCPCFSPKAKNSRQKLFISFPSHDMIHLGPSEWMIIPWI